jgi:hypothetical protein
MPEFRAFKLYQDAVEEAINLDCSEEEAEERARKLATDGPVELWQGARLIARYEASGTARARALLKRRNWLTTAWGLWAAAFFAAVLAYLIFTSFWPGW